MIIGIGYFPNAGTIGDLESATSISNCARESSPETISGFSLFENQ